MVVPSDIKMSLSSAGCWADTASMLLGRCSPFLLLALLLPPSASSLSWGAWEQWGGDSDALRSSGACYKKCAGHTEDKRHQLHVNRNSVKAETEVCGQLFL